MKRKITKYPTSITASSSIDPFSDSVTQGISEKLNVSPAIAQIITDWYGEEDMYTDFDDVEDYVAYICNDIYDLIDVLIEDGTFKGAGQMRSVAKALGLM